MNALRQLAAWLKAHWPERSAFRTLMFNAPRPNADAQIFVWNGVSIGGRFFGTVYAHGAVAVKDASAGKSRIILR